MRRAATLAELLVALVLAAIVLGAAGRSVLHQQRTARRVAGVASNDARMRMASELMRSHLSFAAPGLGDLSTQPTDSSIQLRIPVALGVVCASVRGTVVLSVADAEPTAVGVVSSPPEPGDSIWWYPGGGSPWIGRRLVEAVMTDHPCPALRAAGAALRVRLATPDTLPLAMPARVTRQVRYSVYRSTEGNWQLGRRDWSDAFHRFAPPQPIAGPFVRRAFGGEVTGFRYFDADDQELTSIGRAEIAKIARVRFTLLGHDERVAAARGRGEARREQVEAALQGGGAERRR